jgi:hypothetical protein
MALTAKQERFAQLVAAGATQSDAYRQVYNPAPDTQQTTIADNAYTLAHHTEIAPMIQSLKDAAQKAAVGVQAWNLDRMVTEAQKQLEIAREGGWRGVSSGNGALEIIGRVTGLLSDRAREPAAPQITRVVVVLNRGADAAGRPQIVESSYEVMEEAKVDDEGIEI